MYHDIVTFSNLISKLKGKIPGCICKCFQNFFTVKQSSLNEIQALVKLFNFTHGNHVKVYVWYVFSIHKEGKGGGKWGNRINL